MAALKSRSPGCGCPLGGWPPAIDLLPARPSTDVGIIQKRLIFQRGGADGLVQRLKGFPPIAKIGGRVRVHRLRFRIPGSLKGGMPHGRGRGGLCPPRKFPCRFFFRDCPRMTWPPALCPPRCRPPGFRPPPIPVLPPPAAGRCRYVRGPGTCPVIRADWHPRYTQFKLTSPHTPPPTGETLLNGRLPRTEPLRPRKSKRWRFTTRSCKINPPTTGNKMDFKRNSPQALLFCEISNQRYPSHQAPSAFSKNHFPVLITRYPWRDHFF